MIIEVQSKEQIHKTDQQKQESCPVVIETSNKVESKKSDKKKGVKFVDEVNCNSENKDKAVLSESEKTNNNENAKLNKPEDNIKMADANSPKSSESNNKTDSTVPDENIEDEVFEKETKSSVVQPVNVGVNLAAVRTERRSETSNKESSVNGICVKNEKNVGDKNSVEIVKESTDKGEESDTEEIIQVRLVTNEEAGKEEVKQKDEKDPNDDKAVNLSTEQESNIEADNSSKVIDKIELKKQEKAAKEKEKERVKLEKENEKEKRKLEKARKKLEKDQEKERKQLEKEQQKKDKEEKKRLEKEKKLQEKENKKSKKAEVVKGEVKEEVDEQEAGEWNTENDKETEAIKTVDPVQIELSSKLALKKVNEQDDNNTEPVDGGSNSKSDGGQPPMDSSASKEESKQDGNGKQNSESPQKSENQKSEAGEASGGQDLGTSGGDEGDKAPDGDKSDKKSDKKDKKKKEKAKEKKPKKEKTKKEKKEKKEKDEESPGCFAFMKKAPKEDKQEEETVGDMPSEPWVKDELNEVNVYYLQV